MPSNDSNTPENKKEEITKFVSKSTATKKSKEKFSLWKIITYILLVLIAAALIFSMVLPSFGSRRAVNSLKFGSYDKKPIEFVPGNYFARQYQTFAQQYKGSTESELFQIWRSAYENSVIYTAVGLLADKAGFEVTKEELDKAIIDSGAYNKDGKFSRELYEQTSVERKKQISTSIKDELPIRRVLGDFATVLTAPDEINYLLKSADKARSFEYAVLGPSLYPDSKAKEFAYANVALFTMLDVSVITVVDEQLGESLIEQISSNAVDFEQAAKDNSLDSYASEGGVAGLWYYWELRENFANPDEVNLLFSTRKGEVTQLFALNGGAYALYKVNANPFAADFEDEEVLSDVKNYIGKYENNLLTAYLDEVGENLLQQIASGDSLVEKAKEMGLNNYYVEATNSNVGQSSMLKGFNYTDVGGYLRLLSNDSNVMRELYLGEIGSIKGPFKTSQGSSVIVKIVSEQPIDELTRTYLENDYPFMAQSINQQDMIQMIFSSDKFEDNFLQVFLEYILGTRSQA
ncbi:MAG: SurA N-terminal domain-containing protein [Sphaerochaetaceae bacterium]